MPDDARTPSALQADFTQIYTAHYQALHAYFFAHTGDAEGAVDLVQETFLRAWRHSPQLQAMPNQQHRYWLFHVAKNLLTDYHRRQATRAKAVEQLENQHQTGGSQDASLIEQVETNEKLALLDRAIQQLPEPLRTVLTLSVLGEMNSQEIAAVLERPAGTVRYQLSQARQQLAATLRLAVHEGAK